ncbi:MAG: DUF115 domain-containing protein, partial [Spirochaetales bacterium]|nr:DUF115 domain-containing protein [Spirochaetales bacterium]
MINPVQLTQSSNGELNILCQGKPLYSRYAPSAAAERAAAQIKAEENCIYMIPSPLLGYGIDSLKKIIPDSSCIIGIETDQSLMAETSAYLQNLKDDRFLCYRLDSPGALYEVFKGIQDQGYRHCRLVPLNSGYSRNKNLYDSLLAGLQHFLKNYWQNRLTMAKMGPLWIKNLIRNLDSIGSGDIADFSTDKAVVVCGAGESLEGTLPLISKYRDSIYILAVDTAVQSLTRFGILPDGVVNLEAQFYNLKDFYPLMGAKVDLFSDITAYPPSLRGEKHCPYFFASSFHETALHRRLKEKKLLPTEIPPLGSVGVAAVQLAGMITGNAIFLTGLDFSYVEGKTHARGTPFHDWCSLQENRTAGDVWYSFSLSRPSVPADALPEGSVTNRILESYARQLEEIAASLPNDVFNLAEQGMRLSIPAAGKKEFPLILNDSGTGSGIPSANMSEKPELPEGISSKGKIDTFITGEKERLEKLISCWEEVCRKEKSEEELLPLLKACDYLYFHFPDSYRLPDTNPAFLFRV